MILTFNISSEPTHNIERMIRLGKFESDFDAAQIKLYCIIIPNLPTRLVRETEVVLIADNTTYVNAQGQEVQEGTEGAVGEYDFLVKYLNNPVILGELFAFHIHKADLKGRFN